MIHPLYIAKKSDSTEKGSRYVILQDSPTSFHVSVQRGDKLIYDHIEQPESMEFLMKQISLLEEELLVEPKLLTE